MSAPSLLAVRAQAAALPRQLAQQLLCNPHYVLFSVICTGRCLFTCTCPIDAFESGLTRVEAERRLGRLVNDLRFANRKLIGHDWRGHFFLLELRACILCDGACACPPSVATFVACARVPV